MTLIDFTLLVVLVALLAAFIICLMSKWGFVEYVQVHGDSILAKMFS